MKTIQLRQNQKCRDCYGQRRTKVYNRRALQLINNLDFKNRLLIEEILLFF